MCLELVTCTLQKLHIKKKKKVFKNCHNFLSIYRRWWVRGPWISNIYFPLPLKISLTKFGQDWSISLWEEALEFKQLHVYFKNYYLFKNTIAMVPAARSSSYLSFPVKCIVVKLIPSKSNDTKIKTWRWMQEKQVRSYI